MPSVITLTSLSTLLISSALAINFPTPSATDISTDRYNDVGFTPKPTSPPTPKELRARIPGQLQARDALTNTCAYYEGISSDPYSCGIGSACIYNTASNYFGCCSVSASSFVFSACPGVVNPYTSCYDYTAASYCTGACYTRNRVCDSTRQFCGTNYLVDTNDIFTQYFCNSISKGAVLTWLPTIKAAAPTTTAPAVSTPQTTTPSSTSTLNNLIISTSDPVSPATSPNTSSPTSPTTNPNTTPTITPIPTPKPSHAGAIAGGVVGGLAILAGLVGAAIFVLSRQKRKERERAHMEISQVPT